MAEYIEREALIRRVKASPLGMRDASGCFVKTGIIDLIKRQPLADVVEVWHGVWIKTSYPEVHRCSVCDNPSNTSKGLHKYCPNCGADMRGDNDVDL